MNFQQKVVQAKELMQQIKNAGGVPYFPDTFKYDRDMGWMVKADYASEIEWQSFSRRSHETGLMEYHNLNDVIKSLRADRKSLRAQNDENMMWAGDEQGYVFIGE